MEECLRIFHFIDYLPKLAGAVLILIFGWLLATLACRITRRLLEHTPRTDPLVMRYLAGIVRAAFLGVALIAALSKVGIDVGPFLVGLGAGGLVIGFALRDILADFANGTMLLIYRPFHIDDYVKVGGETGFVSEITIVKTRLRTPAGDEIFVPNKNVWSQVITRYREAPRPGA
ncbi:MAG TPA: mechanosensitive ion channel [bacterium]|uniref:Small-conductance mechanosensitive channel n=1 Tax=candidate division TA06 bacterium ADurb.Bin417 TaxID=1852828 RepID=A0A1V5MEZ2_UNCT6|nr:MAG: Small-conductance mechanosensitive channel [candidate division TA06 bacterium ADurb.Bin417]HNQ35232.1 mechanosensitive ion channel [bacterium]HNS47938.1 mechanosensitive ion channel [bacterium]